MFPVPPALSSFGMVGASRICELVEVLAGVSLTAAADRVTMITVNPKRSVEASLQGAWSHTTAGAPTTMTHSSMQPMHAAAHT